MRYFSVLLFSALLLTLTACNSKVNREADVKTLEKYLLRVDSAESEYLAIPDSTYSLMLNETKSNLRKLKMGYKGELDKDQARIISDYNNIKRLIKDFPRQHKRIGSELIRTKEQLKGLLEVMKSGADIDGSGNEITDPYLDKQMMIESKVAESLIEEISELDERLMRTKEQHDQAKGPMLELLNQLISQSE